MSRKIVALCLLPIVAFTFVGCGGSPNKSPGTLASAGRPREPDRSEETRPDERAGNPAESSPFDRHDSHSDATTPDDTLETSKFDPRRFELPAPAPTTPPVPESEPPEPRPTDPEPTQSEPPGTTSAATDPPGTELGATEPAGDVPPGTEPAGAESPGGESEPQAAGSTAPEPRIRPGVGSGNPLRRAIARPAFVAAPNQLRAFGGFADPKSVFSSPPPAPVPAPAGVSASASPPEAFDPPSSDPPSSERTVESAPDPSGGAVRPEDVSAFWPEPPPPSSTNVPSSTPPIRALVGVPSDRGDEPRGADEESGGAQSPPAAEASPREIVAEVRAGAADQTSSTPEPAMAVHEAAETDETDDPNSPFTTVRVFYATDRLAEDATSAAKDAAHRRRTRVLFTVLCGTAILGAGVCLHRGRRVAGGLLAMCAVGVLAFVWVRTADSTLPLAPGSDSQRVAYRNERGQLELGQCEVTIPKIHKEGKVERPQVWRLEFQERNDKHMILKSIERRAPDVFFQEVRQRVRRSPSEDLFVFVHGYNVSFETAALRTAQMAKDLDFQGAPIFYSWPSQGGLLRYTVDENNVTWTVPHLKQFLGDLSEQSGAKAIHLIAHSMGNRALTAALREMAFESRDSGLRFQQIVLAAPDIDAEVFRRDIAPVLTRSAERVTLYASSNDQALAASKLVHGYPRAGDSGRDLVVVPGIETIDVSAADTSLLGHSYYGSSEPILDDLKLILGRAQPASGRPWLELSTHDGRPYWIFDIRSASLAGHSRGSFHGPTR